MHRINISHAIGQFDRLLSPTCAYKRAHGRSRGTGCNSIKSFIRHITKLHHRTHNAPTPESAQPAPMSYYGRSIVCNPFGIR